MGNRVVSLLDHLPAFVTSINQEKKSKRIWNPVEHLRWSFLRKTTFCEKQFSTTKNLKAPSQMFASGEEKQDKDQRMPDLLGRRNDLKEMHEVIWRKAEVQQVMALARKRLVKVCRRGLSCQAKLFKTIKETADAGMGKRC